MGMKTSEILDAIAANSGESLSNTASVFAEGIVLTTAGGPYVLVGIPIPAGVNQYFRVRSICMGIDNTGFGDGGIWHIERFYYRDAAGVLQGGFEISTQNVVSPSMSFNLNISKAPAAEMQFGPSATLQHSYSWRYSVSPPQQAPFVL
jgi:hypothetical protein